MFSTFPGRWEFYFIFLTNGSWRVELLSQRLCALYTFRELPTYPPEWIQLYDDQQCINIVYKGTHFSKSSSTLDIINIFKIACAVLFHNQNVNLAQLPSHKEFQLHGLKCSWASFWNSLLYRTPVSRSRAALTNSLPPTSWDTFSCPYLTLPPPYLSTYPSSWHTAGQVSRKGQEWRCSQNNGLGLFFFSTWK